MADIDNDGPNGQFEVEITDLDPAEGSGTRQARPAGRLLLRWQRPEQRTAMRRLSYVLLACLVCALLALLLNPSVGLTALLAAHWPIQRSSESVASPSRTQELPALARDISCPVQTAWSPDSSLIAVLGYTQPCTQGQYTLAQVDLYDAATLRPVGQFQPDNSILTALQQAIPPAMWASLDHKPDISQASSGLPTPSIIYQQITWSPDNTHLALSFYVTTRFEPYSGLLLLARDGRQVQTLLFPQSAPGPSAPLIWNVQSGQGKPLAPLAPALTYHWDAHDTLLSGASLSQAGNGPAYASDPIGNPDGGNSFTVWQPGLTVVLSIMHTPSAYLWLSTLAAWSPDGRYLVTNLAFSGLMEPPGHVFPTSQALQSMEVYSTPQMPAHDPALIASSASAQAVAWNPAGTILAAYNLSGQIDLYTCSNGQLLRTLKPSLSSALSGSVVLLSWSPDGRSLLLSSSQWGLVHVWRGSNVSF